MRYSFRGKSGQSALIRRRSSVQKVPSELLGLFRFILLTRNDLVASAFV